MLKALRNKKFMRIMMWSLVVIFALWGAGSVATSRNVYAGSVFGKKISLQEYNRSYGAVLNRAKMMYGDNLPKLEKFLNLRSQAWDRLILTYSGKKEHIKVSNKEVIEKIASFPFFQRNGVFDKKLYEYIVSNVFRSSERDFEESVRGDILIDALLASVTKNITAAEEEINQAYRDENETADVSFIIINPQDYQKDVAVDEKELLPFYSAHMENFLSPLEVDVDYLHIPFNDKKDEARFTADELMASVKKNKSLKETAKEYNLEIKNTGFFSMNSKIPEIGLSYAFSMAAMKLNIGEIGDIVEASDSFYIMQLKSKKEPAPVEFEKVKDRVRAMLVSERADTLARAHAGNIISNMKNANKNLEDIAKELNTKASTIANITRKSYVSEIGQSESFSSIAFSLKAGDTGGPAKTQKGYAIIRLDKLTPIDEDKFKEEKENFKEKILNEKKQKAFEKWFVEIKKKAKLTDNLSE